MEEEVKGVVTEPVEFTLCPHCGLDYSVYEEEVSEEDKEAWVRHILGESYFKKTFSLMGGRLEVTLRSRKDYENRDVSISLSKWIQDLKSIIN